MNRRIFFLGLAMALTTRFVSADCGGIPYVPGVRLFEPNQRAVIAFNGKEEILLLSTDLRASAPTKVLEVLPLPSEPKVSKGDLELFKKATDLINKRLVRIQKGAMGGMGGMGSGSAKPKLPAGVVTFQKKIGAHDITVTHVLNKKGFIDWVEQRLRKDGAENPTIPEPMKQVVAEYLKDHYNWFVFDVVDLGDKLKTKDAIQYRFKTNALYYPMRITRTGTGDTYVQLIIVSHKLHRLPKGGGLRVELAHKPIKISDAELKGLGNQDIFDLLKRKRPRWLRIWEVRGPLAGFKKDIIAR